MSIASPPESAAPRTVFATDVPSPYGVEPVSKDEPQIIPEPFAPPKSERLPKAASQRLVSLDAFRGLVMVLMVSAGLYIPRVVENLHKEPAYAGQATPIWDKLAFQTDHTQWVGCSLWDLIQPSFMFMVGAAMAFSVGEPAGAGAVVPWDARPRDHPVASCWSCSAVFFSSRGSAAQSYELALHQRPGADRPRVHVPVPAGVGPPALAGRGGGRHPRALLGRVRRLPKARGRRLRRGTGPDQAPAGRVGPAPRLRAALGQEPQPGRGVRPVVPQPLPPRGREAVRGRGGRLPDAQLRPVAGDDDLRPARGRIAPRAALARCEVRHPACRRRGGPRGSAGRRRLRDLPGRQADLDPVVGDLQHRDGRCSPLLCSTS